MSVDTTPHVVRFGDFTLDLRSGELSRNGRCVLLPEQPFRLLVTLIRERGQLVTRETLQRQLWTDDTFVDFEGGLNATVKRVREVLGDSATSPVFIETLPRRGYRFVAPVEVVGDGEGSTADLPAPGAITSEPAPAATMAGVKHALSGGRWMTVAVAAAAIAFALVAWASRHAPVRTPGRRSDAMVRITNLGRVTRASLSADGQDVAYVTREGIQESLWIRHASDANAILLAGPLDGAFDSLTAAPNGFVYYTFFSPNKTNVALYRVPIKGGSSEVVADASGWIAFSPDGSRYASVRNMSLTRESRLIVVDAATGATRVVATRKNPESFVMLKPAWSPDGTHLALFGASDLTPGRHDIVSIDVRDGTTRRIASLGLAPVDSIVWLPSGLELVVAGMEGRAAPQRLWFVSAATGAMRPLTSDVSDYALAGVRPDGSEVLAVRLETTRGLWMAEAAAPDRPTRVAEDAGSRHGFDELAWTPDGQILYTAVDAGNADIWSVDPSTRKKRRLTTDPANDYQPTASGDGRIVFSSNRSGVPGLWSMWGDGSDLKQLTSGGDTRASFSPDGKWVAFLRSGVETTPWGVYRLWLDTGKVEQAAVPATMRPDVSPDGRFIAHYWMTPERWVMAVTPAEGGVPTTIFSLGPTHSERIVHWAPDGRALTYIDGVGGAPNIWLQPLDHGPARQLTHLTSEAMMTFDWSSDGLKLVWMQVQEVKDIVAVALPGGER
jgi:Tol biopolymer transport system component/DNA-binding winged helix-turn-helix (wHTH) protein